jgi:hypothetical protein
MLKLIRIVLGVSLAFSIAGCSFGLSGDDGINISGNATSNEITVTLDGSVVRGIIADTGNATGSGQWISILGSGNVTTSGEGSTITIEGSGGPQGEVGGNGTAGATGATGLVGNITTDAGTLVDQVNISILGSGLVGTAGSGSTVTITGTADYPKDMHYSTGGTGRWRLPGWWSNDGGTFQPTVGLIYYIPLFQAESQAFDKIGVTVVGVAGGAIEVRLYAWGSLGLPGTQLYNWGTIDCSTVGAKTIDINLTLARGYYWLAVRGNSTATINCLKTPVGPLAGMSSTPSGITNTAVLAANGTMTDPARTPAYAYNAPYYVMAVMFREVP